LRRLLVCVLASVAVLACSEKAETIAPPLPPPPIDPRLESLAQGELALAIGANARQDIDPLALARQAGTLPACADFIFFFSWRTQDEKPVSFLGNRQGGEFDIARGASGEASVSGCILLQASNVGAQPVQGELRYIIARTRQ
jgi:hypothetical protein